MTRPLARRAVLKGLGVTVALPWLDAMMPAGRPSRSPRARSAHNHKRVPFFIAGRAGGRLGGGQHLKAPNGTPLANVMLGLLHSLGLEDLDRFGDSTAPFDMNHPLASVAPGPP